MGVLFEDELQGDTISGKVPTPTGGHTDAFYLKRSRATALPYREEGVHFQSGHTRRNVESAARERQESSLRLKCSLMPITLSSHGQSLKIKITGPYWVPDTWIQ
jgi:hypothetical protein